MSLPQTDEERAQFAETSACAGLAENVVSTACPECRVRFATLARYTVKGWLLRCTRCGYRFTGKLK